jgi:NAD(P)-dependent dehydrogenase (short-subunit alcohol dehydrogenase family)
MTTMTTMTTKTVALVTGANKGLGLEIARQLGQRGLCVVLGARDPEKGAGAARTLAGEGLDVHALALDVTKPEDVATLPGYFAERFGRLDVLVNNAGVAQGPRDDIGDFRRTFEVNVFGAVAVTYALLPLLAASPRGRIVNHSSVLGSLGSLSGKPERFTGFIVPAYTASKAALNGFTVALALKTRGTALKVNAAHPGWVRTDLGGKSAPLDVTRGAETAVTLATLPNDGPSGQFFHLGEPLPW